MVIRHIMLMGLGLILILLGTMLIRKRKTLRLPRPITKKMTSVRLFFMTMGIIATLAGIALLIAPILIGKMGIDFWIVFTMGVIVCLMILITFFLPRRPS
ncbi:MAG: hypothetical protein LKI94_07845 [Sporolactobacillus sp.]|jgi:hypothetical protein|nr:hypothetical protein [Sporolactobacillus sp.]